MDSSRDIVRRLRENRILAERKQYEDYTRDELIKLAQDGDQLAIERLVTTHQDFINKMSNKYFLADGDKEDVKQVATIAFWNAIQSWDGSGDFEAYAGMIIKRKLTDELRKEEAGKSQINTGADSLDRSVADDGEGGEMSLGSTIQSKSLSPEEEYLGRDGASKIMKFMKEELSDTERQVIMRYIEGYKVSEISEELNMKYKSAENALRRVKDKLAEYMRNVRESKQDTLNESIFSDEEKQVLKSVLSKINMNESEEIKLMTKAQILERFDKIRDEGEILLANILSTRSEEDYGDYLDKVEELLSELVSLEDEFSDENKDELSKVYDELHDFLRNVKDAYPENIEKSDPYSEVGMSRSDF